ncbi:THUMP-like domain-containing protein [Proteiniphilum sp.]|uniref:THUMP-like domain-containing protein n=1 Tax=Proteiniphilum sp. TaxID=1926877 RepID=UPI002B1EDE2E|nr:SAM-dependent methyltransferase [Proteiniphilum sp.]MEA4917496.1 SAM-dependent methyltransferase [Proteiniphilum sp.]MEA4950711.1 SAM-dependent methyltransferase [Petrimonas sp.]
MQLTSEQKQFILTHERQDVRETALRFVRDDMPLLLAQIAGRQMAEKKIPSWYAETDIVYPPHLSLEQSSSELTACYKASLVLGKNETFADLTGGMGVDFSFLSPHFREAEYVEQNEDLCRIAEHNFAELGLTNATIHCAGAGTFLRETAPLDFIYLDPSRRDNIGRKVFRIEDCNPDLSEIKPLLLEKSNKVMVKYSPMLDISLAVKSLGCVSAVHVVSVDNECKELLFLLSEAAVEEPLFIAVNLKKRGEKELFSFTMVQEQKAVVPFAENPGHYLYEPNTSILKAGAFKSVAQAYHFQKLHINSHLYTSDELVADFPGRVFEVETFFVPNKKNIKIFLQDTKKANITVRNFPMTVAGIRRKTGLTDGGDIYLFATTFSDERKVWVKCRRVN